MTFAERFWTKVDKSAECWTWNGTLDHWGYGQISREGRNVSTHRAAWELANGAVPAGQWVLHRCDVPRCVNVAHLYLGSAKDNTRDMRVRDRERNSLPGSRNRNAKLTEQAVSEIRRRHVAGESACSLGREFGIKESSACRIIRRERWTHVP